MNFDTLAAHLGTYRVAQKCQKRLKYRSDNGVFRNVKRFALHAKHLPCNKKRYALRDGKLENKKFFRCL